MNVFKIYGNYYIETSLGPYFENNNFSIIIFDSQTNHSYKGILNTQAIEIPNSNIENIHLMLKNALETKPNYSIEFFLDNLYISLRYKNEIFSIVQTIKLIIANEQNFSVNYQLALIKIEHEQLKHELSIVKHNFVPIETFTQLLQQYENISVELIKLKDQFEVYNSQEKCLPTNLNEAKNNQII